MEGLLNFLSPFPLKRWLPSWWWWSTEKLHKVSFQCETSRIYIIPTVELYLAAGQLLHCKLLTPAGQYKYSKPLFLKNAVLVLDAYGFIILLCHIVETFWFKLVESENRNFKIATSLKNICLGICCTTNAKTPKQLKRYWVFPNSLVCYKQQKLSLVSDFCGFQ